jgi:hypothetical protein
MMLYEVRRAAAAVAEALRADDAAVTAEPVLQAVPTQPEPVLHAVVEPSVMPPYTPVAAPDPGWATSSYAPTGSVLPGENPTWS